MISVTPCNPAEVKVTLLKGGRSGEREVSLRSGAACAEGLRAEGFQVVEVDTGDDDMIQQIIASEPDVVFCALHGRDGEDGRMQGMLELMRVPYTGSGVLASALAMDKTRAKAIYRQAGLPTPGGVDLVRGQDYDVDAIIAQVGERCVVKPASEGSSLGMTIVEKAEDLGPAIEKAFGCDSLVLVETFVSGIETTVAVLGNGAEAEAMPVIEIVPQESSAFYDFEAKYAPGGSTHVIPARISDQQTAQAQRLAVEAHKALGCAGASRTDIIVGDGEMWILETNTLPGMTATSLLPDTCAKVGIGFNKLCRLLVEMALEAHAK